MLFEIHDKLVHPTPQALMVPPFKDIWDRDESENKKQALAEFAYIEFMSSMTKNNPYRGYHERDKHAKIKNDIIQDKDWEPDQLITDGINKYKEFQTEASETYSFYMSAKKAANKLEDFFNNFSMTEINERTGNPLYKPRDITSALKDTTDVLQRLADTRKKVDEETYEKVKNKGDKEVSLFANPDSVPEDDYEY